MMNKEVKALLKEDDLRVQDMFRPFDPVTGEGSILTRFKAEIKDFPLPVQYLPVSMKDIPLIKGLCKAGSIKKYVEKELDAECDEETYDMVVDQFVRIRHREDFAFWAACVVYIKKKGGGEDILFRLNKPQRKLITRFEECRLNGMPIREIVLKARQWGGSTATQMYFAWLQLVHKVGLNSLIVAHVKDTSIEILDMFDRMLKAYPVRLLHELGDSYQPSENKWEGVLNAQNIHRIPQKNCKIKIGTAEKPDTARGGDYNLVHCSEVGLWKKTEGKSPEDIVRSATSGILLKPYTAIVYESTANGTGNFFQREYDAAKRKRSEFHALFVSWFEIEQYRIEFDSEEQREEFAQNLYENRDNDNVMSDREESGKYLWWLWKIGASLAAINWYIHQRSTCNDHGVMASEFPSNDVEAFVHSGAKVFDPYKVEELRGACRPPRYIGEVSARADSGSDALSDITFDEDRCGHLWVWEKPEVFKDIKITDRYLTVVDIGGRSNKADWSVIVVFDRLFMRDGDKPSVVAQWYGHIDMDILAWKSAQIAKYYDNSLLVIESNTLDTHDPNRDIEGGDQSLFILNQIKEVYDNLYARKQSDDDIRNKKPVKYGFHTNTATKPVIISNLIKVIRENLYVERDERCLDEYLTYEKEQNGAYNAMLGKHDDLLMTRAIGMHICFNEMDLPAERKKSYIRDAYKIRHDITEATF